MYCVQISNYKIFEQIQGYRVKLKSSLAFSLKGDWFEPTEWGESKTWIWQRDKRSPHPSRALQVALSHLVSSQKWWNPWENYNEGVSWSSEHFFSFFYSSIINLQCYICCRCTSQWVNNSMHHPVLILTSALLHSHHLFPPSPHHLPC